MKHWLTLQLGLPGFQIHQNLSRFPHINPDLLMYPDLSRFIKNYAELSRIIRNYPELSRFIQIYPDVSISKIILKLSITTQDGRKVHLSIA